jgi:hypothetical protein
MSERAPAKTGILTIPFKKVLLHSSHQSDAACGRASALTLRNAWAAGKARGLCLYQSIHNQDTEPSPIPRFNANWSIGWTWPTANTRSTLSWKWTSRKLGKR